MKTMFVQLPFCPDCRPFVNGHHRVPSAKMCSACESLSLAIITNHWSFASLNCFAYKIWIPFIDCHIYKRINQKRSWRVELNDERHHRRFQNAHIFFHISATQARPFCPRLRLDTIDKPLTSREFFFKFNKTAKQPRRDGRRKKLEIWKFSGERRLGEKGRPVTLELNWSPPACFLGYHVYAVWIV